MNSSSASDASVQWLPDQQSPVLGVSSTRHRHRPIKRQASAMCGNELAQSYMFNLQAQFQPFPGQAWHFDQQHSLLHEPAAWQHSAATGSYMSPAADTYYAQLQCSHSGVLAQPYGLGVHCGMGPAGTAPAPEQYVFGPSGAPDGAPVTVADQGPMHRLPKRRASAPLLTARPAAAAHQQLHQRVAHLGGPDCPCTQCLCARTDQLCRRLAAKHGPQQGATWPAATVYMQPSYPPGQQQQQYVQQQGQVHSSPQPRRRSSDLPPLARPSRHSPGSPCQPVHLTSPRQQHQQHQQRQQPLLQHQEAAATSADVAPVAAAAPPAASTGQLAPAAFGHLGDHLGSLALSGSGPLASALPAAAPTPHLPSMPAAAKAATVAASTGPAMQPATLPPPDSVAASATAAAMAGGVLLGRKVSSSCQSGVCGEGEDEDVDRELQELLSQVDWPAESACGESDRQQQQLERLQQQQLMVHQQLQRLQEERLWLESCSNRVAAASAIGMNGLTMPTTNAAAVPSDASPMVQAAAAAVAMQAGGGPQLWHSGWQQQQQQQQQYSWLHKGNDLQQVPMDGFHGATTTAAAVAGPALGYQQQLSTQLAGATTISTAPVMDDLELEGGFSIDVLGDSELCGLPEPQPLGPSCDILDQILAGNDDEEAAMFNVLLN